MGLIPIGTLLSCFASPDEFFSVTLLITMCLSSEFYSVLKFLNDCSERNGNFVFPVWPSGF